MCGRQLNNVGFDDDVTGNDGAARDYSAVLSSHTFVVVGLPFTLASTLSPLAGFV